MCLDDNAFSKLNRKNNGGGRIYRDTRTNNDAVCILRSMVSRYE